MDDAIIISDLHLGSEVCNDRLILEFLDAVEDDALPAKQLILNGDVFDSWDFRRLKKKHWKILSRLRSMSDHRTIIWIGGNHDGPADLISHLLGLNVADTYVLESGGRSILVMHGHQFDSFIDAHPLLTKFADFFYFWLQKIDKSVAIARKVKKASKIFLRCTEIIKRKALAYAQKRSFTVVCLGHTHLYAEDEGPIGYYNSGCWTEGHGSYLAVKDGVVQLRHFTGYKNEDHTGDGRLAATDQRGGENLSGDPGKTQGPGT
jgi:UDP-2,3-diacylglucosamine pyrophosphatase LpxH